MTADHTAEERREHHFCKPCNRSFVTAEALAMHTQAKHIEGVKKPFFPLRHLKRIRIWVFVLAVIALVGWGILRIPRQEVTELNVDLSDKEVEIPAGQVHWHPKLTIQIDGKRIPIPTGIGIHIGKVVDTHLSEMGMSPTHTHESDGTIHIENNDPSKKPETLALGYFFYVWGKRFNSTCIFDYCTDKGTLHMYVNGQENIEFENYIMRDKDDIRIEYTSFS